MKINDVKQIIDYLCEKFNVAQEYLVPAMRKYMLISDLSIFFLTLLITASIIFVWYKLYKKFYDECDFEEMFIITGFVIAIGTLVSLGIMATCIWDAIVWGTCPDMALMNYIIDKA